MPKVREKTLSYRRAEWFGGASGITLERCVRDAHKALKNVGDRSIFHGDQIARSAKQKDAAGGGMLLHITTETPGESASVVPKVAPTTEEIDLKTARPPTDGEWLDGDAFLFVKNDHVCICTTGIRDGAIRFFLHQFFRKAKIRKDAVNFDLMKVADMKKVKMLHSQGVKELVIRAAMYKAANSFVRRKSRAMSMAGAVAKHAKAILGKPNDVSPDGLRVLVTLKTDERFGKKAFALGEAEIETLAADVVNKPEEDDDYVIITKTGQKITPKEIFMRSRVSIESDGKTVRCDKAWNELVHFFNALNKAGILEGG
ncbi:MAG: hypothetical protein KGJ53_13730 [Alphaproteobacteria bacterium]|nr:hypothetical protein [Alphaproteobacteria bacterium]